MYIPAISPRDSELIVRARASKFLLTAAAASTAAGVIMSSAAMRGS